MDLLAPFGPPSDEERAALDGVVGAQPPGTERAGGGRVAVGGLRLAAARRQLLLPALHALQDRVGFVSREALGYLSQRLDLAPADAYGVASAYAWFSFEPGPRLVVHVCDDVACAAAGGGPLALEHARRLLGSLPPRAFVELEASPCLGHCEHGSAALAFAPGQTPLRATLAPLDEDGLLRLAARAGAPTELSPGGPEPGQLPPPPGPLVPQARTGAGRSALVLLRRVGVVDPCSIDAYRAAGGFAALRRALELGPTGVLAELEDSRLLGRGGAAFPTAAKWAAVARNPVRPHYVVANADESEPGTFKDRVLLEHDPFALVEALAIAGITVGAEQGYVYVRVEYPLAEARVRDAVEAARRRGLLGSDVMGSGRRFDIEVRRGAGAYVAGEETALLRSIEGLRPEPRNKPPYPVDRGLFGKPTVVNNVETLACVLEVLRQGGRRFATLGTAESTGTRLFCLSGAVERPGVYEVPLGTELGTLLELAGGVRNRRPLRAVLLGGAAGNFLGPDELDVPLSFEGARARGASLGSGAVVVCDDRTEVAKLLARIARFFRDESCGQCVPCRIGTVRLEELLARSARRPAPEEQTAGEAGAAPAADTGREATLAAELAADLAAVLADASICGLGQAAANALASALAKRLVELGPGPSVRSLSATGDGTS
jgi:NADH-quinone oxidoreductase subunit F